MIEWRPIDDFDGYEVSSNGQIRFLGGVRKFGKQYKNVPKNILKPQRHTGGYLYVSFRKDGKKINKYIHRLVAEAFIPNPLNLPEVNHLHEDNDKTRNIIENLEWSSKKQNMLHKTRVLKIGCYETNPSAKLTWDDVKYIRESNESNRELANKFNISVSNVTLIKRNETWKVENVQSDK